MGEKEMLWRRRGLNNLLSVHHPFFFLCSGFLLACKTLLYNIRHQLHCSKFQKNGCFHGVQAQTGRRREEELTVSFLSGTTVLILALLVL